MNRRQEARQVYHDEASVQYIDVLTAQPLPTHYPTERPRYVPTVNELEITRQGRELEALADVIQNVGRDIAGLSENDPDGATLLSNARAALVGNWVNRLWKRQ